MARASLAGNDSSCISTSGWSRGMMLVPLDLRLVSLGRDSRDGCRDIDGRFGSLSDMSEVLFDEGLDSVL